MDRKIIDAVIVRLIYAEFVAKDPLFAGEGFVATFVPIHGI